MENQTQDMNYTTKYVPGSLGTITETEKESVTSSESFRRKYRLYIHKVDLIRIENLRNLTVSLWSLRK